MRTCVYSIYPSQGKEEFYMFHKRIHHLAALTSLSLFLLLPVTSKAENYQLQRNDTKMTCIDTRTGSTVRSRFITYKGNTYYFDANGYAHTGWLTLGQDCYFFNSDGTMKKKQWLNQYYFQANGKMARNKWVTKTSYVGSDGRLIPGYKKKVKPRFVKTKEGTKYRNHDGSYSVQTWQCIKGHWYYFYSTGIMATNRQIGKFYVDKQGRMVTKKWVRIGNRKYYYGPDGRLRKTQKLTTKKASSR